MESVRADVTVVGGGIAGICAAVAAARNGARVALVNDRPVLGGNASSEVRVHINGSAYQGASPSYYAREGGLAEEIKLRLFRYNPLYNRKQMMCVFDAVLLDMVYGEPNIALYLNTSIHNTGMEKGRIVWVDGLQLASERSFRFESPYFIDCSGDGIVGYQAGASFMRGREGKEEFGESLAPGEADLYTMGDTILFQVRDAGFKEIMILCSPSQMEAQLRFPSGIITNPSTDTGLGPGKWYPSGCIVLLPTAGPT
ncbi:MAG: hypothetical protein K0R57_6547 [Paenibacillaceae bacterium]|jgi:hypothetical protein|nr:hypothetical protein [Paenibacillaceae bacterium]